MTRLFECTLAILSCILALSNGQEMRRHCTCSEMKNCYDRMKGVTETCGDQCKTRMSPLGGKLDQMKSCVTGRKKALNRAWNCIIKEGRQRNYCSSVPTRELVQSRSFSQMRSDTKNELRRKMPSLFNKLSKAVNAIADFMTCSKDCVERLTDNCFDNLKCSLKLPSSLTLMNFAKHCAIAHGFNEQGLIKLCNCVTKTVKGNLQPLCPGVAAQLIRDDPLKHD